MYTPRFRMTSRMIKWMDENYHPRKRFPEDIEKVFFKSKESEDVIAYNLVQYAERIDDPITVDMEKLIEKHPNSMVQYIKHLHYSGLEIRPELLNSLKGNGSCLAELGSTVGRLPRELEQDIVHPENFLTYVTQLRLNKGFEQRIIEQESIVFFSNGLSPEKNAEYVAKYALHIGVLPPEFKELLKANNNAIMEYSSYLLTKKLPLDDDLQDCLAGDDKNLLKYAQNHIRKRLPIKLEKTLTDPQILLNYARNVVRNRLPEELENNLVKDHRVAVSYAFDVIRAFACIRLPEVVHAALVMKSFETPDDHHIKRYIGECERDTSVPGTW